MTTDSIKAAARQVDKASTALKTAETDLLRVVGEYLEAQPESLRKLAERLGLSHVYLYDIKAGRRGVSRNVVTKLLGRGSGA